MSKLSTDFRTATLAVAGGIFTSLIFVFCEQVNTYYEYLSSINDGEYEHYSPEHLRWIPISFWHTILFIVAAFIAHRYFAGPRRSSFLLWQVIGGMSLLGWLLTLSVVTGIDFAMRPEPYILERAMNTLLSWEAVRFATVIFAGNVIYGSLIQSASQHYMSPSLLVR